MVQRFINSAYASVVYRPVVIDELDSVIIRNLGTCIFIDVCDQRRAFRQEILGIKLENAGNAHELALGQHPQITRFAEELYRCFVELLLQLVGAKRLAREPRAANRHAIERKMHALVAERADYVVLQRVKRYALAADRKALETEEPELGQSGKAFREPESITLNIDSAL